MPKRIAWPSGVHCGASTLRFGSSKITVGFATTDAKPTVIFEDPKRNVLAPQWTPDGQAILFGIGNFNAFFNGFHGKFHQPADRVEGGAQVALVQADGSGYRELTT